MLTQITYLSEKEHFPKQKKKFGKVILFYIFVNLYNVLLDRSQLDSFIYFGI